MGSTDYEALGRYHAALEAATRLRCERRNALVALTHLCSGVTGDTAFSDQVVARFDPTAAEAALREAIRLHDALVLAVADVNRYAGSVNKPGYRMV